MWARSNCKVIQSLKKKAIGNSRYIVKDYCILDQKVNGSKPNKALIPPCTREGNIFSLSTTGGGEGYPTLWSQVPSQPVVPWRPPPQSSHLPCSMSCSRSCLGLPQSLVADPFAISCPMSFREGYP